MISGLQSRTPIIAPSMLKCDFGNLQREITRLESAEAALLHFDVMDGHFVPNLSYGAMLIRSVRDLTRVPFEAHLMISEPGRYVDDFLAAGCDLITFHVETVADPIPLLRRIRKSGAAAGLALNPETPVEAVASAVSECDLVLVMSVQPGFGGQAFQPQAIEKLSRLKELIGHDTLLSVDGGIGPDTISVTAAAGANLFVVGSAIFDRADYREAIEKLRSAAVGATVSAPL